MNLVTRDPNWGVFQSLNIDYPSLSDKKDLPSKDFFRIMGTFLATVEDVCLYRIMFLRGLIPMHELQTGFFVNGEPGTGKGVINRLLKHLVGTHNMVSMTLKDLASHFARHSLVNASVLVLNEVDIIYKESANLIQGLLGRDPVSYEKKHVHGLVTHSAELSTVFT